MYLVYLTINSFIYLFIIFDTDHDAYLTLTYLCSIDLQKIVVKSKYKNIFLMVFIFRLICIS